MNSTALPYSFRSEGRRITTAAIVALIWMVLFAAYLWLEASLLILIILGAFTLPAIFDLALNPIATFTLDTSHLRWNSGRQSAEIALNEIDHLRFDTRLDMSVRLSIVRPSGVKIRVPFPATPPVDVLDPLAVQAGLTTRRHHFSLMG